jgi:serine/threonine-protein kinase
LLKPLMGVGLAAVLMGVGVGAVMQKGDSDPAVPEVPGTSAAKDPVAATDPKLRPSPTPREPLPKVETPPQLETPSTQPALAKAPESEKAETNSAQENATSSVKPRSAVGTLQIVSRCWAHVYIDGKRLKRKAPLPPFSLPAGPHKLRLLGNASIENPEADIEITAGATYEYKVKCPIADE